MFDIIGVYNTRCIHVCYRFSTRVALTLINQLQRLCALLCRHVLHCYNYGTRWRILRCRLRVVPAARNVSPPPSSCRQVILCFSVSSATWGIPEVGGRDNLLGSYCTCPPHVVLLTTRVVCFMRQPCTSLTSQGSV